jgi:hypothetical protein
MFLISSLIIVAWVNSAHSASIGSIDLGKMWQDFKKNYGRDFTSDEEPKKFVS